MYPTYADAVTGTVKKFTYKSKMSLIVTKPACPSCGNPIYGSNTRSPDYAVELIAVPVVRESKRKRFVTALASAGVAFSLLFASQMAMSSMNL